MMTLSYNIQMKPVLVPVSTLRVECCRSQMLEFGLLMGTVGALAPQRLLASIKSETFLALHPHLLITPYVAA